MDKKFLIYASLILLIIFNACFFTRCRKESTCQNSNFSVRTQKLDEGAPILAGKFYSVEGKASLSYFSSDENGNVTQSITDLLTTFSISVLGNETPIGLAAYYSGSIDTTNLTATLPSAFILYKSVEGRIIAKFYNYASTHFVADTDLWGITTMLSTSAVYYIIEKKNLSVENVVVLEVVSGFPENKYMSTFEVVVAGGGNLPRPNECNDSPACNEVITSGDCTGRQECHLAGPGDEDECSEKNTARILSQNNYTVPVGIESLLYKIRDSVLSKNIKGVKFIDDYYFSGTIINDNNITLNFAIAGLNLYHTNFFRKLSNASNPLYNDTILINLSEKNLIFNLCDEAEAINGNARYQNIIDSVRSNVNRLYNHSINYFNTNF